MARLAASETQLRGSVDDALGRVDQLQKAQEAYSQLAAQEKLVFDTLPVGVAFFSDRVIVRWVFDIVEADGRKYVLDELAYQTWCGDRIASERFYYDPTQRRS